MGAGGSAGGKRAKALEVSAQLPGGSFGLRSEPSPYPCAHASSGDQHEKNKCGVWAIL